MALLRIQLESIREDTIGADRQLITAAGTGAAGADENVEEIPALAGRYAAEHAGDRIERQTGRRCRVPAQRSARPARSRECERVMRADEAIRQWRRGGNEERAVVVEHIAVHACAGVEQRGVDRV